MQRLKVTKDNEKEVIEVALATLLSGGIVIFPTETCYGIGVDATNQSAVDRLFMYKERREGKPLSIAVADREMASQYVEINEIGENLYTNYLPGPITVVSKSLGKVAKGIESEYGTVGIRIPDYPLVLKIIKKLGSPMTSTSANMSYQKTPYSIDELLADMPQKNTALVDLIIDAGPLPHNPPSTVVDTTMNNLNIMREGSLKFNEDLEKRNITLQAKTITSEETINFGGMVMIKNIDAMIDKPLVFLLSGELGAGKTQFVKGLGKTIGVESMISSPTYTIIDEHEYTKGHRHGKLVHIDMWRVDGVEELSRIGLEKLIMPLNIIAIEWADKFYNEIVDICQKANANIVNIKFEHVSETSRDIKVYDKI